jgi:hypothetical protein
VRRGQEGVKVIRTNAERADRASATIEFYNKYAGDITNLDDQDAIEEHITDILTDLHHFLRKFGDTDPIETMADALRFSVGNFDAEVKEDK